ncbi:MAG: YVTN family beta-propeller repeat protein [Gaiellaceae bacterium]
MTRRSLLFLSASVLSLAACGGAHHAAATARGAVAKRAPIRRLVPVAAGTLPAPVQDAAGASFGGGAALLGGLTPADVSTDAIVVATRAGSRRVGHLPIAVHDTAAVPLGRLVYLFGGGYDAGQLDPILEIDPRTGAVQQVGRLPARSSDQAGAALGGTAYVVGGYTGTRWLDTIVAWRPGARARVVAHLPHAVRYAAVAAADGRLVIAGGSLESGTASDAVYVYVPATGRVTLIGRLPAPTTHAAAAAIGPVVYVIGGRGAIVGTPTARIVAVAPAVRKVVAAGSLRTPLSDLTAVSSGDGILVAGGRSAAGTVASLTELVPRGAVRSTQRASAAPAGVPPLLDRRDVYAADSVGNLSPAVRGAKQYVYVPNSDSNTVDVIDQRTMKIVRQFAVGAQPQHVVPAYDLKTLYVTNDAGNSLTAIDPRTGRPGRTIPVEDPYNMYFTPDGRYAIVVAERLRRLDFRAAHTFRLHHSLRMPCVGADHMDFSATGRYAIVSCEFSGQLVKVDIPSERVVGTLTLRPGAAPQDVKLSPDGTVFYVADMNSNGVWLVDGDTFRVLRFMHTGRGAHGLYPSRDARYLYVTNRGEGSISVVSFRTRRIVKTWRIPGGGSPDMGNVSADGKVLWLSGRYNAELYAISTRTGKLLARIHVGFGPHGVCVWPQPGRYSLGHTGILR